MRRLILCAILCAVATPADACCFRRLFRRHHRPVAVVHCAPTAPSPQGCYPQAVPYCPTGACPVR